MRDKEKPINTSDLVRRIESLGFRYFPSPSIDMMFDNDKGWHIFLRGKFSPNGRIIPDGNQVEIWVKESYGENFTSRFLTYEELLNVDSIGLRGNRVILGGLD